MAFLLSQYVRLIKQLKENGYNLVPVKYYFLKPKLPVIFLRHDVDRFPSRALTMAKAESAMRVASTYYFRCSKRGKFPEKVIREISRLGHEIGFHYETASRSKGDFNVFKRELEELRKIAPVRTVTAHGSPLSNASNMKYGRSMDLTGLKLLGDPMQAISFIKCLYVTDSGGIFGSHLNKRDWADGNNLMEPTTPEQLARVLDPEEHPMVLLNCHSERWAQSRAGFLQAELMDKLAGWAKQVLVYFRHYSFGQSVVVRRLKDEATWVSMENLIDKRKL